MKEVNGVWVLEEPEVRRKAIELLDGMNMARMNLWISSGILAGALETNVVGKVLVEEIERRSPHVREYWLDEPCTCGLSL